MMSMVINDDEKISSQLLEILIREGYFDDAFINHKADYDLAIEFQLQHYQGIHKKSKKTNTVIAPNQRILLKKVKLNNPVETSGKMKDDQIKMVSKEPVKLKLPDGSEAERRIMITCRLSKKRESQEEMVVQA